MFCFELDQYEGFFSVLCRAVHSGWGSQAALAMDPRPHTGGWHAEGATWHAGSQDPCYAQPPHYGNSVRSYTLPSPKCNPAAAPTPPLSCGWHLLLPLLEGWALPSAQAMKDPWLHCQAPLHHPCAGSELARPSPAVLPCPRDTGHHFSWSNGGTGSWVGAL